MNKIRPYQILIAFLVLIAGAYFGYQAYAGVMIDSKVLPPIEPGKVTLLGVDAGGQGYKIIVSNEIAQLIQTPKGGLSAPDMGDSGGDEGDATDKKHVPLKEMVESLQGDKKALGDLVVEMSDELRKFRDAIVPKAPIWTADDLKKVLAGDKALTAKFTHDTNVDLHGMPANFINPNALYSGITIDLPVPVRVDVKGVPQTLVAHVQVPYRSEFTKRVSNEILAHSFEPTTAQIEGYYLQDAKEVDDNPAQRENVAKSIRARLASEVVAGYAEAPERILSNTTVILNETCIADAHKDTVPTDSGKTVYDLVLDLSDEGRDRLWKYSRHRSGTQLLLIVNGVAIAAPFVRHELEQKEVTITQMVDPDLVDDAVSTIKSVGKKG